MKNEILISIIIPVYNVEKYIKDCMESIMQCNSDTCEIIVVNDGSTDSSLEICNSYLNKTKKITIITQTNQGLSEARNAGIRSSKGKYLLFLDSDDKLHEKGLEQIIRDCTVANEDFLFGRAYKFYNGSTEYKLCQINYDGIKEERPYKIFEYLNSKNEFWFAAWLVIIKRDFLINNNLFFKKGIYHEDELWVPSVFVKADSVKLLNYGFYLYRMNREGSIVYSENIKREFDKITIVEELEKLNDTDKKKKPIILKRQAALIYGILIKASSFKDNDKYNELLELLERNINKLKNGKYFVIYLSCKMAGVKSVSRVIGKIIK